MSDNRTTELRAKLTERGIEYTTNDHMGVCETSWNGFTAMQLTPSAKLMMAVTPEQAIAATLESDQEANLDDALNEVAEKWAEAQVSAEEYAKRCRMLESLARDMFTYIDNCCESDLSFGCVDPVDCAYYDKARDRCTKASSLKQRMKALGLEVDR